MSQQLIPQEVWDAQVCKRTGFMRKVCFCEVCRPELTLDEAKKLVQAVSGVHDDH